MATYNITITVPNTATTQGFFQDVSSFSDTIVVTCYGQSNGSFRVSGYYGCTPSLTSGPYSGGTQITLTNLSQGFYFNITATGNCYGKSFAQLTGGVGNFLHTSGAISLDDLRDHFGTDTSGIVSMANYFRNHQFVENRGDNLVPSVKSGGDLTAWTYSATMIQNSQDSDKGVGGELSVPGSGGFSVSYKGNYLQSGDLSGGLPSSSLPETSTAETRGWMEYIDDNGVPYHLVMQINANRTTGSNGSGWYTFGGWYRTYTAPYQINQNIPVWTGTTSDGPISLSNFYGADSEGIS